MCKTSWRTTSTIHYTTLTMHWACRDERCRSPNKSWLKRKRRVVFGQLICLVEVTCIRLANRFVPWLQFTPASKEMTMRRTALIDIKLLWTQPVVCDYLVLCESEHAIFKSNQVANVLIERGLSPQLIPFAIVPSAYHDTPPCPRTATNVYFNGGNEAREWRDECWPYHGLYHDVNVHFRVDLHVANEKVNSKLKHALRWTPRD